MSRSFDGVNDEVRVSIGAADITGAHTVCAIIRVGGAGTYRTIYSPHTAALQSTFQFHVDNSNLLSYAIDPSARASSLTITAGTWYFVACTKAAGTTTISYWSYDYSTNTWAQNTTAGTLGNPATAANIRFGLWEASGDDYNGDIAIAGAWTSVLTDAQIRSLPFALPAWYQISPAGLWLFDQAATTMNVTDLSGGGANQTTLAGTTVSALSVPVFSYGHPVVQSTVAAAVTTSFPFSKRNVMKPILVR